MTVQRFQDFQLHVEFRLPKGSSAGIFPRRARADHAQGEEQRVEFRNLTIRVPQES